MSEQPIPHNVQLPPGGETGIRKQQLTVEVGLYAAILAIGLILRLYRLGLAPLSPSEAQLALAGWRGTMPAGIASPLLGWMHALLFTVFGSSDGIARLIPALTGAALVAAPALWRERIGRVGALGAAAILAISPVAIATSRTSSGDTIVAALVIGLAAAADRYLQTGRSAWLTAGAAILGIGLASGAVIYSGLLALLVGAGLAVALGRPEEAQARWRAMRDTRGLGWRVLGVMVAVFAASATGLMWRPGGLAAAIDLFPAWLTGPAQTGATAWHWPLQVMVICEPLAIVTGLVGLTLALGRNRRFAGFLITWLLVAMLLSMARPARTSGDVLLAVIPLAMLGGYALQALGDSLRSMRFSVQEGILMLVMLPVIAYFVLGLAANVNNPAAPFALTGSLDSATPVLPMLLALALVGVLALLFVALTSARAARRVVILVMVVYLALMLAVLPVIIYLWLRPVQSAMNAGAAPSLPLGALLNVLPLFLAVALVGILIALFATLAGAGAALRGAILTALVALATVTWAAGWGAAQSQAGDPRALLFGPEATAPSVRNLVRDLRTLSSNQTTDPSMLAIVVESSPDGVLGWYLRDMPNAQFVAALDVSSAPAVLVTTDLTPPALSGSYAGERFTLRHEWRIENKAPNDVLKWILYRKSELPQPTQQAILWVKQENQ